MSGSGELIDEKDIGEKAGEAVDLLLGLVLAVAPLVVAPVVGIEAASSLWHLIEPKNELMAVFRAGTRRFSRSKPSDYLDRARRMSAANCMLVYTAYFDALQQLWPSLAAELELSEEAAKSLLAGAVESDLQVAERAVAAPHPGAADASGTDGRRYLYGAMTDVLETRLGSLLIKRRSVEELLDVRLPDLAESLYQAEYLEMMLEFEQFFRWSDLRHQVATEGRLRHIQHHQAATAGSLGRLAEDHRTWFERPSSHRRGAGTSRVPALPATSAIRTR